MKAILIVVAALGVSALGGCATYYYPPGNYYYYDYGYGWGYGGDGYRGRGGRSEPGNESAWYPARPDGHGGRGGGGVSSGGERGSR